MFPFITIGGWRFGSYGICLVTGFFIGYFILRRELARRELRQVRPVELVLAMMALALVASKLYLIVMDPRQYLAHPLELLRPHGFVFYGGLIGDMAALVYLARRYRVPFLTLCDSLSAACALGYGIGRVGCLLAGDGDYGLPTTLPWGMTFPHGLLPTLVPVHPTPIYEFLTAAVIARILWIRGAPARNAPPGEVFGLFLVLTGVARLLVEFIKRNHVVALGLVNAQWVALASIAFGLLLLASMRRRRRADGIWIAPQVLALKGLENR